MIKAVKKIKKKPLDDTIAIIIERDENGNQLVRLVNLKTGHVIDSDNMADWQTGYPPFIDCAYRCKVIDT